MASPSQDPAPVTIATRPSSRPTVYLSSQIDEKSSRGLFATKLRQFGGTVVTPQRNTGQHMTKAMVVFLRWLIRLLAVVQLALGVLFWTGNAYSFLQVHMLSGMLLVLALWIQAAIAARAGIGFGLPIVSFFCGILVVSLGMTQDSLLPGDLHWLVKVLHLLGGGAAGGPAESPAVRTLRRRQPALANAM